MMESDCSFKRYPYILGRNLQPLIITENADRFFFLLDNLGGFYGRKIEPLKQPAQRLGNFIFAVSPNDQGFGEIAQAFDIETVFLNMAEKLDQDFDGFFVHS